MADNSSKEKEEKVFFRRILVGVDTSSHSRAALEAAAFLAQKMEGKLFGLFVQDEVWSKICKMPSVTAVNELTGATQNLKEKDLQEQIDLLAKRLRRQLRTISRENKISHTWKTVRGCVEDEILEAAKEADLITIGRRGSSFPQKKKLGSSAKAIIQSADKPILILKKGLKLGQNITALYDGSEESKRSIQLALSLADEKNGITILVLRDQANKEEVKEITEGTLLPVEILELRNPEIWRITHFVNKQNAGLFIIPKNQPLLKNSIESVLNQLNTPLLMMN